MGARYFLPGLLAVLAVAGCGHKGGDKDASSEEPAPVTVAEPEVMTVTLTQSFPGNLQSQRKVDIVARVDGIFHGYADSGGKVRKGQLLYTIDDAKYRDAVNEAEATLATAQAEYEYYSKQYSAMQKALKADAVSEMEVLQAKNNMNQSLASIKNAKAALDEARTMLGYCRITAPFDGTLALQVFDNDTYINGEASPVTLNTLYNDATIFALIAVPESRYAEMLNGVRSQGVSLDSVRVNFSSPLQHEYYSKINYSAPLVSTSTGTVTMRFDISNPYGELKDGMYMNVELPYAVARDALLIRDASIGTDQQGKYVYLVNDSSQVVYTPIEVGELYRDSLRIVTKGLTPQSRYVTEALLKVRDGMKVRPVQQKK